MHQREKEKEQKSELCFSYSAQNLAFHHAVVTISDTDKPLAAMSAFWKPFSAQSVLGLSEQEVRAIALTSITELQQQIELIRTTFNIPVSSKEITKREIERMIEEKLNARNGINQEPTVQALPLPDNYNTHR